MDILSIVQHLGLPGLLFLAFFFFAHISIIEFVKVAGNAVKRKLSRGRAAPLLVSPAGQPEPAEPFIQGVAVMMLSLLLGTVLGGVMLNGVAGLAGIELPRPLAGALLGLVLGVITSGWVARQTRLAEARGGLRDEALGELLARLPAPVVQVLPSPAPATSEVAPALPDETIMAEEPVLRPVTSRDARATHFDWSGEP